MLNGGTVVAGLSGIPTTSHRSGPGVALASRATMEPWSSARRMASAFSRPKPLPNEAGLQREVICATVSCGGRVKNSCDFGREEKIFRDGRTQLVLLLRRHECGSQVVARGSLLNVERGLKRAKALMQRPARSGTREDSRENPQS